MEYDYLEAYHDEYTQPWIKHGDSWSAFENDIMCSLWPSMCTYIVSAIVDCNLELVNWDRMDIYFDSKQGTSTKNLSHLA